MLSSRVALLFIAFVCAVALAAPKQMVFGFGKRSMDSLDDIFSQDMPMKRYKPKSFAMGFGKRGGMRNFNMGFGKRSVDEELGQF